MDANNECTCKDLRLKVLYLNVRSINPNNVNRNNPGTTYGAKVNAIKQLIAKNNPDIIAFVETWLSSGHRDSDVIALLQLQGYKEYRQDRSMDNPDSAYYEGGLLDYGDQTNLSDYQGRRGGGIMVAIRSDTITRTGIIFSRYPDEDLLDAVFNFQILWNFACSKCDQGETSKKFLFSAIYRRPNKLRGENEDSYENYNQNVIDRMKHLGSFFADDLIGFNGMVMVGDFNWITTNSNFRYVGQDNFFTDFEQTHKGGRALDHIIYYPGHLIANIEVTDHISDHSALVFDLDLGIGTEPSQNCEKCQE